MVLPNREMPIKEASLYSFQDLKYGIHLVDILCVFSMTVFCKVNVKSCIDKPAKGSICSLNAGEGIINK